MICVAPPSNTPGILSRRALPAGRLAGLGATLAFHHGLLGDRDFGQLAEIERAEGWRDLFAVTDYHR